MSEDTENRSSTTEDYAEEEEEEEEIRPPPHAGGRKKRVASTHLEAKASKRGKASPPGSPRTATVKPLAKS